MEIDYERENVFIVSAKKKVGSSYTEIEYCIQIFNYLNVNIYNIIMPLIVPRHTRYKSESIYVNDKKYFLKYDKSVEIALIKPRSKINIRYSVYLDSIPENEQICNELELRYLENNYDLEYKKIKSNSVITKVKDINLVDISGSKLRKQCSKKSCRNGDVIEYKLFIKNDGEIVCDNLLFKEYYDENIEFIEGSFKINNTVIERAKIYEGVYLGQVGIGEALSVTYRVKVGNKQDVDMIKSISYLMYPQKITSKEKKYKNIEIVSNIKLIVPQLIEKKELNNVETIKVGQIKQCYFLVSNKGNVDIEDVNIMVTRSEELEILAISLNEEKIDIEEKFDNIVKMKNIKRNEDIIICIEIKAIKENTDKYLELGGNIIYGYLVHDEGFYEEQTLKLDKKLYSMIYADVDIRMSYEKVYYEQQDIIKAMIQIKNTGNVRLYDLVIKEDVDNTCRLIDSNQIINNLRLIEPNEVKLMPINFEKKEDIICEEYKFKSDFILRYIANNESCEVRKIVELVHKDNLDNIFEVGILSTKDECILGEKLDFKIKIYNRGYKKLNQAFLKLNIPCEMQVIDNLIYIGEEEYNYLELIDGINLGDIDLKEEIFLRYSTKVTKLSINNSVKTYCLLLGSYSLDNDDKKVVKEYKSNILMTKIGAVSAKAYIKNNKSMLLAGEDINYNTIIINDGTVPISVKYRLQCGNELQEVKELAKIDGERVENTDKPIKIDPSDGVIVDNTYVYSRYRGVRNIKAKAIIEIYYTSSNGKINKYKDVCTETLKTEITNTTFKEICLEKVVDISSIKPKIKEIVKIYLNPIIINKWIRKVKRDYSFNLIQDEGYRLHFTGNLRITMEYLSCEESNEICSIIDDRPFTSNITLPQSFVKGEFIDIQPEVLDKSYKLINEEKLFINVDLLINTSM